MSNYRFTVKLEAKVQRFMIYLLSVHMQSLSLLSRFPYQSCTSLSIQGPTLMPHWNPKHLFLFRVTVCVCCRMATCTMDMHSVSHTTVSLTQKYFAIYSFPNTSLLSPTTSVIFNKCFHDLIAQFLTVMNKVLFECTTVHLSIHLHSGKTSL